MNIFYFNSIRIFNICNKNKSSFVMSLKYENLKSKYLDLFDGNNEYFDYVMTDVIFVYEEISKIIEENKINKVLEVGSGTGIVLKELKDKFKDIEFVGLDPNQSGFHKHESVSKKLKQIDSAINIIKTSINNYDSEKKYDLIFSFNVFEHVSEQQKYLLKTYDLLAANGKNIIYAPNYDVPYEPHFVIPIIFNKKITKKIFKKKIQEYETKAKEDGLWEDLNFTGKKEIKAFLDKNNFNYIFDDNIVNTMISRASNDSIFRKRQGIAAKLSNIGKKLFLDKVIFQYLKIPFPYFKLIISK